MRLPTTAGSSIHAAQLYGGANVQRRRKKKDREQGRRNRINTLGTQLAALLQLVTTAMPGLSALLPETLRCCASGQTQTPQKAKLYPNPAADPTTTVQISSSSQSWS
eukprot:2121850-Amphidinium_carterae.1